ncbi:murein biosynthesis integral membrane protein MurJ [Clostridiaceae bacterium HSG29]|nr:murein biosynthesis integral membrane protein MurJ [Clostridiaceae bacterium HSG29]
MNNDKGISIIKISFIVSIIIMAGKIFGFARDAVIAAYYGANWQTDAFFLAQSMPAMIFPAVCNSLSTAFISLYISRSIEKGEESGESFASRMLIATIFIAGTLSVLAIIFAPWIVPIFAPGFSVFQTTLAIHLTRLTMGAFVLTMAHYMISAILNSKKLFYGSQIAALGYNLTVIMITIGLGQNKDVDALTLTVIFGHFIQVIILIGFAWKHFDFTLRLNPFHNDSKLLIRLALPILFGNSIVQINNIVDKILASLLEAGAVSALSYSNSLNRFVTGIFIITLSTVIYPSLTASFANKDIKKFNSELLKSLAILPIVILPISIITTIYALDIVSIVYERGNFNVSATKLTATALMFYAGMYVFSSIQEVIIRAFYALKDTKTPMINGAIAVIANSIISVILVRIMGIGGIALGTTISTALASVILWVSLKRKLPDLNLRSLFPSIGKVLLSASIMIIILLASQQYLISFSALIRFLSVTFIGFIIYFGMLILLKCRELMAITNLIKRKFSKAR